MIEEPEPMTTSLFLSKHYDSQNSLGAEKMQLVQTDSVVAFVCFCRRFSSVSSVSGVTEQENSQGDVIVYILGRNVAAYLQIL